MRLYGICHMNKISPFIKKPKEHSHNILSMKHHQTLKVKELWPWAWGPWKGKEWINIVCITQWKAFCCNNLRRPKQEPWLVMHGLQGALPSLSLCYLLHRQIFASLCSTSDQWPVQAKVFLTSKPALASFSCLPSIIIGWKFGYIGCSLP